MGGTAADRLKLRSTPTTIIANKLLPPTSLWVWLVGQCQKRNIAATTKLRPIIRTAPFMSRIKQIALAASSDSGAPLNSRYAAKLKSRNQQSESDPDSGSGSTLDPQDAEKFTKSLLVNHPENVSWKKKFRKGMEFELEGVKFYIKGIGHRCLILRPRR